MLRAFGLGAVLYVFWLLLSGHYDSALLLGLGVVSCVLSVYLSVRMRLHQGAVYDPGVWMRVVVYLPWLIKEIFVANVEVAKIILSPHLPISPSMVTFHGEQETEVGKALYANSITLTPGTITTGIEGQEFEIHALTAADLETEEQEQMDRRCCWVEKGS